MIVVFHLILSISKNDNSVSSNIFVNHADEMFLLTGAHTDEVIGFTLLFF